LPVEAELQIPDHKSAQARIPDGGVFLDRRARDVPMDRRKPAEQGEVQFGGGSIVSELTGLQEKSALVIFFNLLVSISNSPSDRDTAQCDGEERRSRVGEIDK
jgi:hypothetical protein